MANRRRSLPPVSPKLDREIRPLLSAVTELLEVGEGVRGDPRDRKLTVGDLVDIGLVRTKKGARKIEPGALEPDVDLPAPSMATPPSPTGLSVSGGFNGLISLTWEIPGALYDNHAYTNIYRAETDNFANATRVGTEAGSFFTDNVRADNQLTTYYYWITFVSQADVEGPTNATAGTAGQALQDVAYLLETLTDNLDDAPATLGAPDETLILHAERFALRTGPADDPVYPLVIQDVNGTPTVVLDTAIIRDGTIQEGKLGPVTFGKLVASDGVTPITTVGGLLKADYIDVDNLSVAEAATFYGDAESSNFLAGSAGWQLLQSGDFEANNATIRGHIEALTGSLDETLLVGNGTIGGIKQDAEAAVADIGNWTRPNTTLIDGNKIYTGDAYVDTLQIKGQAVTFPRGVYSTGVVTVQSVLSVQSMQIGFTGAPVIILFSFSFREQNVQDEVSFVANIEVAGVSYYSTGTVRAWQPGTISSVFLIDLSAGTRTVSITVSASGGALEINNRSLVILEAKR